MDDNVNVRSAGTRRKHDANHVERVRMVKIGRDRKVYLTKRCLEVEIIRRGTQDHVLP